MMRANEEQAEEFLLSSEQRTYLGSIKTTESDPGILIQWNFNHVEAFVNAMEDGAPNEFQPPPYISQSVSTM